MRWTRLQLQHCQHRARRDLDPVPVHLHGHAGRHRPRIGCEQRQRGTGRRGHADRCRHRDRPGPQRQLHRDEDRAGRLFRGVQHGGLCADGDEHRQRDADQHCGERPAAGQPRPGLHDCDAGAGRKRLGLSDRAQLYHHPGRHRPRPRAEHRHGDGNAARRRDGPGAAISHGHGHRPVRVPGVEIDKVATGPYGGVGSTAPGPSR